MDTNYGYASAVEMAVAIVMPPMVPASVLAGISGLRDGVNHQDSSQNGADDDSGDPCTIGVARRWSCDCTDGNHRRCAQGQERFPH
jgi:hypothetical protein